MIKQWFAPPTFADSQMNQSARILNAVLWATAILLSLFVIVRTIGGIPLFDISNLLMGSLAAIAFGLRVVLRQGHIRIVSWGLVTSSWLLLAARAGTSHGIHDTAYVAQIILILIASLLLGLRVGLFFMALTIISGWVYAIAEVNQLLIPAETFPLERALSLTIVFAIITVFIYSFINSLRHALEKEQQNSANLEQLGQGLENEVRERTKMIDMARQEAEVARQEVEDQMWFTTGQAELSTKLSGQQDSQALAMNVVTYLCHYLDAAVGGLFMVQGDQLHLLGRYALADGKNRAQEMGDSFLGATAVAQKPRIFTDLPPDYLVLPTSGGDIQVTAVLLHPIVYNRQTLAVIELGFLQPISDREQRFIDLVDKNIAIAFYTTQAHERLNTLLQEKQQQAEELQVQEEELRSINEELATQADSWRQAETDMRHRLVELEAENAELREKVSA